MACSGREAGALFLFFILRSFFLVEGYMYNHTLTRDWRTAFPRALKLGCKSLSYATTTKCHTKETLYTPVRSTFPLFLKMALSIGRPGRAGTSSPRASPSRTWEGGRSMMRCGSGAGKWLLA